MKKAWFTDIHVRQLDDIPMFINEKFSGNYWNIWGASGVYSVGASKDVQNPEVRRVRFDVKDIDAEVIREAVIAKRKLEAGAGSDTVNIPEPWIDSVFYKLNMDVFEQVIQRLRENEFQTEIFTDGFVTGNYTASEDGWLMLTIPNDGGWEISVNGETVSARDGINTFMTIPGEGRTESCGTDLSSEGHPYGNHPVCGISDYFCGMDFHRKKKR